MQVLPVGKKEQFTDLPPAECDTSKLGSFDNKWLVETFNQQVIDAEWAEDEVRLNTLNMPEMTGGVNSGDRCALYYFVRRLKPLNFLEIGTHIGSSTVALALAAARNQAEGINTKIITIDIRDVNNTKVRPWLEAESPASPKTMVEALGLGNFVTFEVNTAAGKLSQGTDNFDMIFLDGDHSAIAVYKEIPLALKRLCPTDKGLIILHDFFPGLSPLWEGQAPLPGPFGKRKAHCFAYPVFCIPEQFAARYPTLYP